MIASFARRAFTLVELMIVVAVIGVLVALLQPGLSMVGNVASQMRCATNLHRLWQAVSLRTADEVLQARKRPLRSSAWPSQVLPYLESGAQFMLCPAGGESLSASGASADSQDTTLGGGAAGGDVSGGGGDDWPQSYAQISDLADFRTIKPTTVYYVPLQEGRYCLKLSDEQFSALVADNFFNDTANADYINTKRDVVYKPGADRHVYWLCIEGVGGDDDFKEAMIHVTEQKDGSFSLDIRCGAHGSTNSLVSKPEGVQLIALPANSSGLHLTLKPTDESDSAGTSGGGSSPSPYGKNQEDDPIANTVVSTSYAMNVYYPQMVRKGAKILLMDYSKYLAYVNDYWNDENMDPQQTGIPIFARHSGRMNVLYADGSVVAEDPKDIDPAVPAHEMALWIP